MAFGRWHEQNLFLEQQIIYESNAEIRSILLDETSRHLGLAPTASRQPYASQTVLIDP